MGRLTLCLMLLTLFFHCACASVNALPAVERYVALGDSYTIGEGVEDADRWPNQVVQALSKKGFKIELVGNPARTGWTSQDLVDFELPLLKTQSATVVTVLIGVNDLVRGVDVETFRVRFAHILRQVKAAILDPRKVVVLTIPDFSVTPMGKRFGNPATISSQIKIFNQVIVHEAQQAGVEVVNIYPISLRAAEDLTLIGSDGLHPSRRQYELWSEAITPAVARVLGQLSN